MTVTPRVWVAQIDDPFGPALWVLIEQFGDDPPQVSIRVDGQSMWGPPHTSKERA